MKSDNYYGAKEVMGFLGCGQTKAYAIIKELNEELNKKNIITLSGRVHKKYFHERYDIERVLIGGSKAV